MRRYCLVLLAVIAGCDAPVREPVIAPANTGLRYLGGVSDGGFAHATAPREFDFPADHGSHPEYRTEWWYFTGNLDTAEQRHFGFELTFFRYALAAETPGQEQSSAWRADQVWMAHFAITDTAGRRFHAAERFARQALGLAGAEASPLRVWTKDWSVTGQSRESLELKLEARDEAIALALDVVATRPHVAHGDNGLDRKGAAAGNASYYYSVPRLDARGSVTVEGETFAVTGSAWMDREWSTSSLEPGVVGWDWFALELSDGSSLMFYRLRTQDGGSSPFSSGSWVGPDGSRTALGVSDVSLTALEHWTSRATGTRYPVAWRLSLREPSVTLEIRPYLQNQELDLSVRYWEGAVQGTGVGSSGALKARGYLELAGY